MAISSEFNTELALVDGARSFTFDSGYSDYGENEWSVAGWTVRGGSDAACEHGASEAMYQMGYRWYTPEITVRPASLPAGGITLARQQFQFPYVRLYYNYGYGSWGDYKEPEFTKWVTLNCANDNRLPVGHAWPSIISGIEAEDSFFTNNPTYHTGTIGDAASSFNLNITGADYTALVNRVATYIAANLTANDRHIFDPQDGSSWTPDQVCGFANAVVDQVRLTVPNASLGIYAYAGHRRAPSFDIPNIYVQVTLGFNDGGIGYSALVDEWAVRAQRVDLRGYGLIAAGDEFGPFGGGICNDTAFENSVFSYSDYVASGCEGLQMESTGHHIPALVGHYTLLRFMRDGSTTHSDVRDDLEANHPDFTAATKALFEFWGTHSENPDTISRTYDLIDALPDNALSTQIKQYWTWLRHFEDVVTGSPRTGVYWTRLEQNLRFAKALQDDGIVHGYAFSRQEAGIGNMNGEREDLKYDANAHWSRHGEYPPPALYDTLKADYKTSLQRPSFLADTTLALCDVTPVYAATGSATDFYCGAGTSFAYIGPGDVTTDEGTTSYGAGIHYFEAGGIVSFVGGLLFLNSFPTFSIPDLNHPGSRWIYIPKSVRGRPYLANNIRTTIEDSSGRKDYKQRLPPFTSGFADPRELDAGQVRMHYPLSRGTVTNINCNPWISPEHNRALMPKSLALREGVTILSEY